MPSHVQPPRDLRADLHGFIPHPTDPPQQDTLAIFNKNDPESVAKGPPYQHANHQNAAIRSPSQEYQPSPQSSGRKSPREEQSLESFTKSQEGDDERSEESAPTDQEYPPRASSLYLKGITSQRQGRSMQIPATAEDNTSVFLKETPLVDPYVGSPKEVQTPRSASSSNKTPTQATFTGPGHPGIPAAFPVTLDRAMIQHHGGSGSPPRSFSQPQPGLSPQTQSTNRWGKEPEATPRFSQDSGGTFHTAGSGDSPPETSLPSLQNPQAQPAGLDQYSQVPADVNVPRQSEIPQRKSTHSPASLQNGRPVSFTRDLLNTQTQDDSWRGPSLDSDVARTDSDRPPSPLTPRQANSHGAPEQGGLTGPIHYGTDHDFDRPNDMERSRSRSPSYSRQLQDIRRSQDSRPSLDPNILEHPAFRAVAEGNGMPVQYYGGQLTREENFIPRRQTAEEMLVGGGPIGGRRSESRSRSRRGSRSSAFFKVFTSPSKSDQTPLPNAPDSQTSSSPRNSPLIGDRRSKRLSIFRSRSGNIGSGSGDGRSKAYIAPRDTSNRGSFAQGANQIGPTTSRRVGEDTPSKSVSNKLSKKLQRASTSAKPEPDSGKKKRFSAIGVSIYSSLA